MAKKLREKLAEARRTKSVRVWVIVILLLVVVALFFFWGKMKGLLIALFILLLVALGLETTDYDLDLWTLMKTWSIQESRVENKNGVKLIGKCVSDNLNCSNFDTQSEAQELYENCAAQIKENNKNVKDVKSLDVYGLDRDKDGKVCESLPAWA